MKNKENKKYTEGENSKTKWCEEECVESKCLKV